MMQRAMAMRSSCPPRARLGFVWVSSFWLILAVSVSVTHCKQLDTEKQVSTTCGANVTLTCNVTTSLVKGTVMKFEWQFKNKTLCQFRSGNSTSKIQCNSSNSSSVLTLTMTILNIIPTDEGVYHCKLHTTGSPALNGQSQVRVEDCLGSSDSSLDTDFATCYFVDVFPSGVIHWYQGGLNLTDDSTTEGQDYVGANGYYSLQSDVSTENGNQDEPYNCSLWIPSLDRYLTSQLVSSGTTGQLQWISIVMGIVMMSFFM